MLIVVSPAKNLNENPLKSEVEQFTKPAFMAEARELVREARKLSPIQLAELMSVSENIAQLNYERFANWYAPFTPKNAKQAIFCFNGDVYQGLEAETLSKADLNYAQDNLRILSGLYGLLRPLDLMQAYRLEMGLPFENEKGKNLYQFWDVKLAIALNEQLESLKKDTLLNLASNEYFKAVPKKSIKANIVTPVFKDLKDGDYKVISFFAKKARGLMTRFVIQNQITNVEDLQAFNLAGYTFNNELSKANNPVFTRDKH